MFSSRLSLSAQQTIENEPIYETAAAILRKFLLFEFNKKPRDPVTHIIPGLPPTNVITPAQSIARIFREVLIDKFNAKVAAHQKTHKKTYGKNLAEQDVAVEIIGVEPSLHRHWK